MMPPSVSIRWAKMALSSMYRWAKVNLVPANTGRSRRAIRMLGRLMLAV
jgi:hypothetical protein